MHLHHLVMCAFTQVHTELTQELQVVFLLIELNEVTAVP